VQKRKINYPKTEKMIERHKEEGGFGGKGEGGYIMDLIVFAYLSPLLFGVFYSGVLNPIFFFAYFSLRFPSVTLLVKVMRASFLLLGSDSDCLPL
jgi:hypothetical protein